MKKISILVLTLVFGFTSIGAVNGLSINQTDISFETEVPEVEEVSEYQLLLEAYINEGSEAFGSITELDSDLEGYTFKLVITIEDELYEIYYNIDEFDVVTGIVVFEGVNYDIQLPIEEEADEEDELDSDFEEPEEDEEVSLYFLALSSDGSIEITYIIEENEVEVNIISIIAGEKNESCLKIEDEEDEFELKVVRNGIQMTFSEETEEALVSYQLVYHNGPLKVIVTAKPSLDELGNVIYDYEEIVKDGRFGIGIGRPENPGKSNESRGLKLGLMDRDAEESDFGNIPNGNAYGRYRNRNFDDDEIIEDEIEAEETDNDDMI